jgi:hypothetical protein
MNRVTSRVDLNAVCDRLTAMRAPHVPLFAAAAAGRIAVVQFLDPAAEWQTAEMKRLRRPVAVLVGDDPDIGQGAALGPKGWAMARRLRYWARAVIVHGSGGEPDHYRAAVESAERYGRIALIETSSAKAPGWGAFLCCPRTLFIVPRDGVHPVAPAMGRRH